MATGTMALSADLERELRARADPERAVNEKAYLKSDLEFIGVAFIEVGRRVKTLMRDHPLEHDEAVALANDLWRPPIFELRAAAGGSVTPREDTVGRRPAVPRAPNPRVRHLGAGGRPGRRGGRRRGGA